jgi:hypothetical protein
MILQNVPTLRHVLLDAAISGDKKLYTDSGEPFSDKELDTIAAKLELGRWNFYSVLYGPKPLREEMWAVIKGGVQCSLWRQVHFPEETTGRRVLRTRINTLQSARALSGASCPSMSSEPRNWCLPTRLTGFPYAFTR